jgi:hypothetical protein
MWAGEVSGCWRVRAPSPGCTTVVQGSERLGLGKGMAGENRRPNGHSAALFWEEDVKAGRREPPGSIRDVIEQE